MALPVSRRTFLFAGASFATYGLASAQESAKDATFSSDVNVVNVFATVHDKQGKIIRTLGKDEFLPGRPGPFAAASSISRSNPIYLSR